MWDGVTLITQDRPRREQLLASPGLASRSGSHSPALHSNQNIEFHCHCFWGGACWGSHLRGMHACDGSASCRGPADPGLDLPRINVRNPETGAGSRLCLEGASESLCRVCGAELAWGLGGPNVRCAATRRNVRRYLISGRKYLASATLTTPLLSWWADLRSGMNIEATS